MICKKCERVDALSWLYMVRSNNDPSINEFIKGSEWRQIARTVWMSIQIYWLNFNKNEYIRIIFWYEWMSEYIRIKKLTRTNIRIYSYPKKGTNEYPNKYSDQKYSNIRIFIYICHTLIRINDLKKQPYMNFGLLFGIGTLKATIRREVTFKTRPSTTT